jgi:protein involved in polysaccharide export with SLBB domain
MQIRTYLIILFLLVCSSSSFGQTYNSTDRQEESQSYFDFEQTTLPRGIVPSSKGLSASIDENAYYVDAGDVFLIKIDVEGPSPVKLYNPMVTPDGYLVLPEAVPSIYVRNILLAQAKDKITSVLQRNYPKAVIESYLYQIHPIRVSIIGDINIMQGLVLFSSNRLADAFNEAIYSDTTKRINPDVISLRNVKLYRKNKSTTFDLLEYKYLGDTDQNPYLMDNDIVEFQYKDTISNVIRISESVLNPITFEHKSGDNLKKAILFAGGLSTAADSQRIELFRYLKGTSQFQKIILTLPGDTAFVLQNDDRIYVRRKAEYHLSYLVTIEGEIRYPGRYVIHTGKTLLSEIIEQAGGFTSRASLKNAMVLRSFEVYKNTESGQISSSSPLNVSQLEFINFRIQNRENKFLVNTDFEKLFAEGEKKADIVLYDGDLIVIPEITKIVFLSGGVKSPGSVVYHEGWSYKQYIESVGGFSDLARKGRIKIVKSRTGKWLDADDVPVEDGDIIYIPEKKEREWMQTIKDYVLILTQVGAISLALYTIFRD